MYRNLCTTTLCRHRPKPMLSRSAVRAAAGWKDPRSLSLLSKYLLRSTARKLLYNHVRGSSSSSSGGGRQGPVFSKSVLMTPSCRSRCAQQSGKYVHTSKRPTGDILVQPNSPMPPTKFKKLSPVGCAAKRSSLRNKWSHTSQPACRGLWIACLRTVRAVCRKNYRFLEPVVGVACRGLS